MAQSNPCCRSALLLSGCAVLLAAACVGLSVCRMSAPGRSCPAGAAPETDEADLFKACATVSVVNGTGSGFFLRRNGETVVVTCKHVVEEQPVVEVRDVNGREYEVGEIRGAGDRDLVVISLSTNSVAPLQCLEAVDGIDSMKLGAGLVCFGDSQGTGVIAPCAGTLLGVGATAIEVDTPYVPGDSGAPIVLKGGRGVIGVAALRMRPREKDMTVKGTRFETKARQIAVRLDNLKWDELKPFDAGTVKRGDLKRIRELAQYAEKDEDESLALSYYKFLARKKDAQAMGWLRDKLLAGKKGLNAGDMVDIFRNAADENIPAGLSSYGTCLLRGLGLHKNVHKGLEYVRKADALGDSHGSCMLGECYQNGTGLERNLDKAIELYEKAGAKDRARQVREEKMKAKASA